MANEWRGYFLCFLKSGITPWNYNINYNDVIQCGDFDRFLLGLDSVLAPRFFDLCIFPNLLFDCCVFCNFDSNFWTYFTVNHFSFSIHHIFRFRKRHFGWYQEVVRTRLKGHCNGYVVGCPHKPFILNSMSFKTLAVGQMLVVIVQGVRSNAIIRKPHFGTKSENWSENAIWNRLFCASASIFSNNLLCIPSGKPTSYRFWLHWEHRSMLAW